MGDAVEPPNLKIYLDRFDEIHKSYGHPSPARLTSIIRNMDPSENPPPIKYLHDWCHYRKCASCVHADMVRPNQRSTHPATTLKSVARPGTHLTIDGLGAFSTPSMEGYKDSFIFTDLYSNYRWSRSTIKKGPEDFLKEVKAYQAESDVPLVSIRTDN